MAKKITILSGKNGAGKTFFAVNTGVYLAQKNNKVLIIDLDFQSRGVDLALGMESRVIYDLVDAIRGDCRMSQALVKNKEYNNLYILETPILNKGAGIDLADIESLIGKIESDFDYIIIDTSNNPVAVSENFAEKSDLVMFIATQEAVSLRSSQTMIRRMKDKLHVPIKLIINQLRLELADKGYLIPAEEIVDTLGLNVCGIVPYDENIYVAFNNGRPLVGMKESKVADYLSSVLERFLND